MKKVSILLRFAVGLPFLYAGVDSLRHPELWRGFMPHWLLDIVAQMPGGMDGEATFLTVFAVFEIILAVWLFTGVRTKLAAMLSTFVLLVITLTNLGQFQLIFRDVGLFFAALALVALERK